MRRLVMTGATGQVEVEATMSLTFYIVYTPETVKLLQLMLYSLLKWSDCRFHLVANGCSKAEQQALQQLCVGQPRLAYSALPTTKTIRHGEALNYLQARHQEHYFCFMDSDIYAVGPFIQPFLVGLERYQGLFSGLPYRFPAEGKTVPPESTFLAGPYTHSAQGTCLGTTFFAIYENAAINQIRQTTGIGFTKYQWHTLPTSCRAQLQALGAQYEQYDTAKVLNLLLHKQGYALHYQPSPALCHIEGVSRLCEAQRKPWWEHLRRRAGRWRRNMKGPAYDETLLYLSTVLVALANGQPLPAQPTFANLDSQTWVEQTIRELVALQAEVVQQQGTQ